MHTVSVRRRFVAQHYLIGGDWGAENEWHSHHYTVEVTLEGETLDRHGYLVDIVDIEDGLDATVSHYRDKTLNDLSELEELNPSLERFAALFHRALSEHIRLPDSSTMIVTLWESDDACASYRPTS